MGDIPNADPVRVDFETNKPRISERYYSRNSKIDGINHTRQDDFQFERKLQIKDWSIIFNTSILGVNDVDTYYLGKACKWWYYRDPTEFYYNLAEGMIENRWTERRTQRNQAGQYIEYPGYIRKKFLIVPQLRKRGKERHPMD